MATLGSDIRYAWRILRRSPGFAVIAILTLALGIGANAAMFSVVNAALLRLPYKNPGELVVIQNTYPEAGAVVTSFADWQEWRKQNRSFSEIVTLFSTGYNLTGMGEPQIVQAAFVSENFFPTLGLQPLRGRAFLASDHQKGAAPVCLISSSFWQTQFGGDPAAVGRTLSLSGTAYTIIGIMPDSATFRRDQLWTPLEPNAPFTMRGTNYLTAIGRLKPGVTMAQALADINAVQGRINAEFPMNKHGIQMDRLSDIMLGQVRPILLSLLGAVGLVLLIACANMANLMMVRAAGRAREFAIRAALGASRARLVRQLSVESVLLSVTGAAAGLLLAQWVAPLALRLWPRYVHRPDHISLDGRVLAFTAAVAVLAAVLFGLAPAMRAFHAQVQETLKEGSLQAGDSRAQRRFRSLLIGAEIALAVVLASSAMLLLRNVGKLLRSDPGFNPGQTVSLQVTLPRSRYATPQSRVAFFDALLQRVSALPGVQSAGATSWLPLAQGGSTGDFTIEGRPFSPGEEPYTDQIFVTPSYLQAMQIRLLRGRTFTDADRADAPPVVLINEAMAKRFWPNEDPIGHRITAVTSKPATIIGIVGNVKNDQLTQAETMQVYGSAWQAAPSSMSLVVRSAADPASLVNPLKQAVYAVDPLEPVYAVSLMNEVMRNSLAPQTGSTWMLGLFAALALLLAAVGIYGVTAYSVAQRTHEIGIRMAIGAGRRDIVRLVAGLTLQIVGIGAAAGLLATYFATTLLRSQLSGFVSMDPLAFVVTVAILAAITLAATLVPVRRATRVHPMEALRYE